MASICLELLTIVLVGQILADGQVCNNGAVKLYVEEDFCPNEEYVQYCHDGKWHWLCAGGGRWSRVEANVVCRQLGRSDHGANRGSGVITLGTNQPPLAYFKLGGTCTGGEYNIGECKGDISYLSTCDNTNGKGWVDCQPAYCNSGDIRLVGGTTNREGRVEVCTQGQHWASICYNEVLAGTVCKMLGFPIEGAMAKSTNSSIVPKVDCIVTDDGIKLSCENTVLVQMSTSYSLAIKCQTHNYAVQNTTSALGAVIALLVLLEIGTVIAWVVCIIVTRKRLSSTPRQRVLLQVNESYTDTALIEPSYSSLGPNYNTVTTSDKAIDDYDVIDHNKPNAKPSNPPPVKVEASKSEDEFYNAEEHMYAAVNKEKKNNVGGK